MKDPVCGSLACALLALAITSVSSNSVYDSIIADATLHYINSLGKEGTFKAQLAELQVDTLSLESEDKRTVKKLTFPIRETECRQLDSQQDGLCFLKENGKFTICSLEISDQTPEVMSDLTCGPMTIPDQQQMKSRVKRSKSRRGSHGGSRSSRGGGRGSRGGGRGSRGGGRGSRPGGGSSIASAGGRRNGRTRIA